MAVEGISVVEVDILWHCHPAIKFYRGHQERFGPFTYKDFADERMAFRWQETWAWAALRITFSHWV